MRVLALTLMLAACNAYGNECFLPVGGHVVYPDAGQQQRILVGVGTWTPQRIDDYEDAGIDDSAVPDKL